MACLSRCAALLAASALVLTAVGCSPDDDVPPRPAAALTQATPYEQAVLADGASALWPLRDADGLRSRDQVADLAGRRRSGTVVGGAVAGTDGPTGARGALFLRSGRIVTPLTEGLSSRDDFSLELALRADACSTAWGRVVGTTDLTDAGREGVEVLHLPSQFRLNPCRVAVEIWHRNKHLGGCHPPREPVLDQWSHLVVVYSRGLVSCFQDGHQVGRDRLRTPGVFLQPGPLGIGGSGSGFQGPLDGMSLSEVAVYDHVLPVARIRAHAALLRRPPTR